MAKPQGLTGHTQIAGVMGWPIAHTKSPRLHSYWLEQYGIDGAYIPMSVPEGKLSQALKALPLLGFRGCNVTIPHKEEALKCVDIVDPLAARVGAVNTITVLPDGKLLGQNTDVFGFTENMKSAGFEYNPQFPTAMVLGAGGAARAIVVGLQMMGYRDIHIVNRSQERAQELVKAMGDKTRFTLFTLEQAKEAARDVGLVVNTTALGMQGHPPLEINLEYVPHEAWVTDVVYAPLETELLKQARQKHIRAVDGLGMLLHQARAGFESWFGQDPSVTPALRDFVLESE